MDFETIAIILIGIIIFSVLAENFRPLYEIVKTPLGYLLRIIQLCFIAGFFISMFKMSMLWVAVSGIGIFIALLIEAKIIDDNKSVESEEKN